MRLSEQALLSIIEILDNEKNFREPLDGDEVDDIIEQIRDYVNLHEGNMTQREYDELD